MEWNTEQIDAIYAKTTPVFLEGEELAARQGIPDFVEEYRQSRVKEAIIPTIIEVASNPDASVLDAGCGHGWYPLRLLQSEEFKAKLCCVDVSQHNIALLKTEALRRGVSDKISAEVADCEHLPFSDAAFDLAYSTESLEHMRNPENFINEAFRVLKKGGILIITTPSGPMHRFWKAFATPVVLARRCLGIGMRDPENTTRSGVFERALSKKELLNMLEATGFDIREYRKAVFLPHESCFQFLPTCISRLLLIRALLFEKLRPLTSWSGLHHIVISRK